MKDSNGVVDTLRNIGDAKLLGGPIPILPFSAPPADEKLNSSGISLSANPNPGQTAMQLRFSLPSPTAFSFAIYDLAGRTVVRPSVFPSAQGQGEFRWDLRDTNGKRVQAGVYFARVQTITGARVLPLLVLR